MPIYYDMRKKYNPSKPEEEEYRAQAVINATVDLKFICEEISERASYTSGDVHGMIIEFISSIKNHLADSHRVHIDELGSFEVQLSSAPKAKGARTTSSDIKIKGVTFRLSKTFIKHWKFKVERCPNSLKRKNQDVPSPAERRDILEKLLHKEIVVSRKEYQMAAGIGKTIAYRDIKTHLEKGWLKQKGRGTTTVYFKSRD
ncbi:MAG TPA: HU family DNA-binding protein [Bacteroidaceae bacterium]|nr:HU family DNA-binding protein [Bacteroidaceae bacterium]